MSARLLLALLPLLATACTSAPTNTWSDLAPPAPCPAGAAAMVRGVAYTDEQLAFDAIAPMGGTVVLCAGVHQFNDLLLDGLAGLAVVRGETGDPADVVVDAGRQGNALILRDGGDYGLGGFTVRNTGQAGANLEAIGSTGAVAIAITMRQMVFEDHVSTTSPMMQFIARTVTMEDVEFSNLGSGSPGELLVTNPGYSDAVVTLRRVTFGPNGRLNSKNVGVQFSAHPGIVNRLILEDVDFDGPNRKLAVAAYGDPAIVTFDRVTFTGLDVQPPFAVNSVELDARNGPLYVGMRDVVFSDNESAAGDPAISTFGLRGGDGRLWMQNVILGRNTSSRFHSAVRLADGWRATLRDVRFGQGANANTSDVYQCPTGYGFVRRSVIDIDGGIPCP